MSTIAVSSSGLASALDLASALAAYLTQQDRRSYAELIKLTLPNSKERAWLLDTMTCPAPDTYGVLKLVCHIFAWGLALERKAGYFFCPLAPTQAKLAAVVSVLQALEAPEALEALEGPGGTEALGALWALEPERSLAEITKAFHDGRVRRACDSAKAAMAANLEKAAMDEKAEGDEGDEGDEVSLRFVEFVFKAIQQVVKEHADYTNPKSYIPNLEQHIKGLITASAASAASTESTDSTAIGARQLALSFHRMCRYDGVTDESSAFGPRVLPPSATHMLNGVRNAFNSGSVQAVVALMVTQHTDHWFGASNLDPRLANLLLGAVKTITGSTRAYDPHDVVAPHAEPAEPVDSAEPTEPAEPTESYEPTEPVESADEATTDTVEHPARKRFRAV